MDSALEGWIAGLVAVGVTLLATTWVEARTRRSVALEDALASLAAAADRAALEVAALRRGRPPAELMAVLTTLGRARALAGRRAGLFPARALAPRRWNLALTLDELDREFGVQIGRTARRWRGSTTDLTVVLAAIARSVETWLREPHKYRRGSLAPIVLAAAQGTWRASR